MAMMQSEQTETISRSAQRRQREREMRYQTILRASETLFASEGYHKTSMERIADLSEVSVGTVYFYFKNKEDLLIQLLDEIGFELRDMLGAEFRKADVSLDGFRRAGKIFFEEFCPKHPERIAIIFRDSDMLCIRYTKWYMEMGNTVLTSMGIMELIARLKKDQMFF